MNNETFSSVFLFCLFLPESLSHWNSTTTVSIWWLLSPCKLQIPVEHEIFVNSQRPKKLYTKQMEGGFQGQCIGFRHPVIIWQKIQHDWRRSIISQKVVLLVAFPLAAPSLNLLDISVSSSASYSCFYCFSIYLCFFTIFFSFLFLFILSEGWRWRAYFWFKINLCPSFFSLSKFSFLSFS